MRSAPLPLLPLPLSLPAALLALLAGPAHADVTVADIFGDHMVIQADREVPVFGTTEPGGKVLVVATAVRPAGAGGAPETIAAGANVEATADADGRWEAPVGPFAAGTELILTITDFDAGRPAADPAAGAAAAAAAAGAEDTPDRTTLTDVLAGDVWLCSGQSNMAWQLKDALDGGRAAAANDDGLRLFTVPKTSVREPQTGIETGGEPSGGSWAKLSPEAAGPFSAVGYFFGRKIRGATGRPVGLIDSSWGGTPSEAWTRESTLAAIPEAEGTLERWAVVDRKAAAGEETEGNWSGKFSPTHPHHPGNLNNGMIAPLVPFALKGAIWYQGESNAERAEQYDAIFPAMIGDWRDQFGQDLPFFWVQLANFNEYRDDPNADTNWAELREAQDNTLDELPDVGQAVTVDVGEADDIHPRNKTDVGERLALAALRTVYGVTEPGMLSPRVKGVSMSGREATVTFEVDGDALQTRRDESVGAADAAPGAVLGFAVAGPGDDARFLRAEARVTGPDTVALTAPPEVPEIAAVRYAWAQNPRVTLFNTRGLPAAPFRTDDRPRVTAGNR